MIFVNEPYLKHVALRSRMTIAVVGLICISACSASKQLAVEQSPNGRYQVVVSEKEHFPVDSTVFVDVIGSDRKTVANSHGDFIPSIVQTAWTKDSRLVGILVFSKLGNHMFFAYEPERNREIDFTAVAPEIRQALTQRFHLEEEARRTASFDSIDWVSKHLPQ